LGTSAAEFAPAADPKAISTDPAVAVDVTNGGFAYVTLDDVVNDVAIAAVTPLARIAIALLDSLVDVVIDSVLPSLPEAVSFSNRRLVSPCANGPTFSVHPDGVVTVPVVASRQNQTAR
jgi:hypothetical protein